jgi:hypothetical protein
MGVIRMQTKQYGRVINLDTNEEFLSIAEAAMSVGGSPKTLEVSCSRILSRTNPLQLRWRGYSWQVEYLGKPKHDAFQHGLRELFRATHGELDFRILQVSQKLRLSPFVVALALRSYGIYRVPEPTKERMFTLSRRLRDGVAR